MADEEKNNLGEIDDWLADLDEAEESPAGEQPADEAEAADGELNQEDIDSLLGGDTSGEPVTAESGAEPADESLELDQSDIDSLFNETAASGGESGGQAADQAAAAEDLGELDQANIDELLGEGPEPAPEAAGEGGIDQAEIDDLFAQHDQEAEAQAPAGGEEAQPAQKQAEEAEAQPVAATETEGETAAAEDGAETVSFAEVAGEQPEAAEESFGLDEDSGFDADAFAFDESIPEIPDESTVAAPAAPEPAAEDIFADEGTQQGLAELLEKGGKEEKKKKRVGKLPFSLPATLNWKTMSVSLLAVLLLAGGGYYLLGHKPKKAAVVPPSSVQEEGRQQEPPVAARQPQPVNHPPQAENQEQRMATAGEAVAVVLTARDQDGEPLRYEIVTPPAHGRLSGDAPRLTYLPNKDFPGEDSFTYRASDSRGALSATATVRITGPVVQAAKPKPKKPRPKVARRPVARARDLTLATLSTRPLVIDWRRIWNRANRAPFSRKVSVEVDAGGLRGKLVRLSRSRYRYLPDPYFSGQEVVRYRFHYAGASSPAARLTLKVKLGDPPPKLVLRPLAKSYYLAGETVVLDAGASKDDHPASLAFTWQQVGGTPVKLVALNPRGDRVAFVAPATFSSLKGQDPVIRVTATDLTGQQASHQLTIPTRSRRQAALWRGLPGDGLAPEPDCPRGDCPGRLLPWPYPD